MIKKPVPREPRPLETPPEKPGFDNLSKGLAEALKMLPEVADEQANLQGILEHTRQCLARIEASQAGMEVKVNATLSAIISAQNIITDRLLEGLKLISSDIAVNLLRSDRALDAGHTAERQSKHLTDEVSLLQRQIARLKEELAELKNATPLPSKGTTHE